MTMMRLLSMMMSPQEILQALLNSMKVPTQDAVSATHVFEAERSPGQSVVTQSTVTGGTTQSVQVSTSLARRRKKSKTYHSHANIAR